MADTYDRYQNETGSVIGFMLGLLTGTVLGAGLGMLLAPKAGSELRSAIRERARSIGNMASEQCQQASETATGWADRGREVIDRALETACRGGEEARAHASVNPSDGKSSAGSTSSPDFAGSQDG